MSPATKMLTRILLIAATFLLCGFLFGLIPIRVDFIREPIEEAVLEATGLNLSIAGTTTLRLGTASSITVENIRLGNSPDNPLLTMNSLHAELRIVPLFSGRIHFEHLSATGVGVNYCGDLPVMKEESGDAVESMQLAVAQLELDNISIACQNAEQSNGHNILVRNISAAAPEQEAMYLEADVEISGVDIAFTLTGGTLNELLAKPSVFPLTLSAAAGSTQLTASGELLAPWSDPSVDARVFLYSSDPAPLLATLDVNLSAISELQIEGRLRANPLTIEFTDVLADLGPSHLSGHLQADMGVEPPYLTMSAELQELDLEPFLNSGNPQLSTQNKKQIEDVDLNPFLSAFPLFNADMQMVIRRVVGAPLEIGKIKGHIKLTDGVVDVWPLTAELLNGEVSIAGKLDGTAACPELTLQAEASEFDLAALNQLLTLEESIGGHFSEVSLTSSSCGKSLLAFRDSLSAKAELLNGTVSIGNRPLPLTVEKIQTSLAFRKGGQALIVGTLAGETIRAKLTLGSVEQLLWKKPSPIELELHGAGGRLTIQGEMTPLAGPFAIDAEVLFDAPKIGTLHPWTSDPESAGLPLRATSHLRYDENTLSFDALMLQLGDSDLSGSFIWRHTQFPDTLEVKLHSTSLDLDAIVAILTPPASGPNILTETSGEEAVSPSDFDIPPLDIDLEFDSMLVGKLALEKLNVSGRLRDGLIEQAEVTGVLEEEVQLLGELDMDLRSSRPSATLKLAASNVDIGNILGKLDIADDLQLRAAEIRLSIEATGRTQEQLVQSMLIDADIVDFGWTIPSVGQSSDGETQNSVELFLKEAVLATGPRQPTRIRSQGQVADVPLEVRFELPSLDELLNSKTELPINLTARAGGNIAMLDARILRSVDQEFLAHVVISGEAIKSDTEPRTNPESPMADYQLNGDIAIKKSQWRFSNLQAHLGSSAVNGDIFLRSTGGRRQTNIDLHSPLLQTDDLLYWNEHFSALFGDGSDNIEEKDNPADENAANSGVITTLNEFFAESSKTEDIDLSLTIDELHAGPDNLGSAELHLHSDEDEFLLKPVNITSSAGKVRAEYNWKKIGQSIDILLKVQTDALSYGGLLQLIDPDSEASGVLYLDTELRTTTSWRPSVTPSKQILKNANGHFDLAAWPANLDAGLLDMWSASLILALLPASNDEQTNNLNCLATRLKVIDGVFQTGTALIDTTNTIIRGRGTIDLAQGELDLLIVPHAKREAFLSVSTPVKVTGPPDDFQIGVEPAGLIGTALKWYLNLIYVPFKWITGEKFPENGTATCVSAMEWELTPELSDYFLQLNRAKIPE